MKKQRKVKAPQLQIRAALGTVNEEDRTVETVFSTGSDVQRYDWGIGRYIERLSLKPANIRWGRLNSGAPVLNTHSSWSLRDVLGVIVEGSARSDGKQATATLRFADCQAMIPTADRVENKISQRHPEKRERGL